MKIINYFIDLRRRDLVIYFTLFFLIILSYGNSIHLAFDQDAYLVFELIATKYSATLNPLHFPIKVLLIPHGISLFLIATCYQLFGFNPAGYFALNIFIKLAMSVLLYKVLTNLIDSKIASFLGSVFFLTNYSGIQTLAWPTLFPIYIGIIFFLLFLLYWIRFLNFPKFKLLFTSLLLYGITLLLYSVRLYAVPLIVVLGDLYFLNFKRNKKKFKFMITLHLFLILLPIIIFIVATKLFSISHVLSRDLLPLNIYISSLIKGNPPIFISYWLFFGSIFIPEYALGMLFNLFHSNYYLVSILTAISIGINMLIAGYFLRKKSVKSALLMFGVVLFVLFVFLASNIVDRWYMHWFIIAQLGGMIFLFSLALIIYDRNLNRKYHLVGWLGILFLFLHLIAPWISVPILGGSAHQSAFEFSSRYYTVPVVGGAILISFLFLSLRSINRKLLRVFTPILIFVTILNIISSRMYLDSKYSYLDNEKHSLYWQSVNTYYPREYVDGDIAVYYLKGDISDNEVYFFEKILPIRLRLERDPRLANIKFLIVTNELDVLSILDDGKAFSKYNYPIIKLKENHFYAFDINGDYIRNIKDEVLGKI